MDIFCYTRKKFIAAAALTLACCVIMVMFPSISLHSARKAVSLWTTDVMPALLPFFICANFLMGLGVVNRLNPTLFTLAMSVMSGYPMGAKIIGDMRCRGEISLQTAKRLFSFCSTSGPAFIMGAVGAGMMESEKAGIIIAVSHYSGALLNGMFYGALTCRHQKDDGTSITSFGTHAAHTLNDDNLQALFTESILKSLKSLGIILSYMVLFMLLTELIQSSRMVFMIDTQHVRALVKGIIEMTVGCSAISECIQLTETAKCVACSFIISWGGFSVIGQSMSMLTGSGISSGYIVLTKLTHGLFSAAVAFVIAPFMV